MKKANKETVFNIRSNKKIFMGLLVALLILSAGFFIFTFSTEKASADGLTPIHHYSKNDNYSIYPTVGVDFSTDINNSSAVLSKTYSIAISETIYSELSNGYNHFLLAYGDKDTMDYLFENTFDCSSNVFRCTPTSVSDKFDYSAPFSDYSLDTKLLQLTARSGFYSVSEIKQSDVFSIGSMRYLRVNVSWSEGNLYDIGIYVVYQYSALFAVDTRTVAYYSDDSIVSTIRSRVQNASHYGENVAGAYEKALGIYRGGETRVSYTYLKMLDGHFNKYETVTDSFNVPSVYVPDESYVWNEVLKRNNNSLAGFDLRYISEVPALDSNGAYGDGTVETFGSRPIRQATGYTYSYSGGAIGDEVTCNVAYDDYTYSDFFIKLANIGNPNDPNIEGFFDNNLEVCIYPMLVDDFSESGVTHLYFDFSHIFDMYGATLQWTVVCDEIVLYLDEVGWSEQIALPFDGYSGSDYSIKVETTTAGNKRLDVSFLNGHQGTLFGIEITGTVPIGENVQFDCYIEYKELDENLNLSQYKTFYAGQWWSHRLGDLKSIAMSHNSSLGVNLYDVLSPEILSGIDFVLPVSVLERAESRDWVNHTCTFQVQYEYSTSILLVTNNLNDVKKVYSLPSAESFYTLEALGVKEYIPSGWRAKSFSSSRLFIKEAHPENVLKTKFEKMDTDRTSPYSISLELVDTWPVSITYYERFKNSPFFIKTVKTTDLRVADYGDIFGLTPDIVSNILGKETLNLFDLSMVERVNVSYDSNGDRYYVTLDYSEASLKGKDYNGNDDEVKVVLTCYADWTASFGKTWTVMMLNDTLTHYFKNTDGIKAEDLYGFFSVAVFRERVTDLNYWFQSYSANGCKTAFVSKEVKGSEIYKFFGNWGNPLCLPYMAFCELFNKDDAIYYSYFFYLDGSTDLAFLAINGADNYDDNDSAFKNKVQDVGESIGDWFKDLLEKIKNSPVVKVLAIVGAVILGVIVLSLVIKLLMFIFRRRN